MQASKALLILIVVGGIVALGVFWFVPNLRPAFVNKWFQTAQGLTPAQTPREALEKFHDCIKVRDYKNASLYMTGPLTEEFKINGEAAAKLGNAIDNVLTAMDNKNLNSVKCKTILGLLQPFPKEMKIKDIQHKAGEDQASALLEFDIGGANLTEANLKGLWGDERIYLALYPLLNDRGKWWQGDVLLKLEGDAKDKGWKILFPKDAVPERAGVLKRDYGNYVQALEGFSRDVKNNAYTVSNLEGELKKALDESKPK